MNIAYTDHFTDPVAQKMGSRQNIEQMMLLFWQDNVPQRMAHDPVWIEDTQEAIGEWLDDREPRAMERGFNPVNLSNFLSSLIRSAHESYEDHTKPDKDKVPGRPGKDDVKDKTK